LKTTPKSYSKSILKQTKTKDNKIENYGNQSMIPAVAILICLSSSTSEKAQIGEKGCSEIVDKRKGDMGLEIKDT